MNYGMDVVVVAKKVSNERAPESEFIWEGADGSKILATRLGQGARANFFMNAYLKIMNGVDYDSDNYRFEWNQSGLLYHQADEKNHIQDYFKYGSTERIHEDQIEAAINQAWDNTSDTTVKAHRVLMNGSDSNIPRERNIWDFEFIDTNGDRLECQSLSRKEVVIPVSDLHSRPWPYYADRHCVYMDTGEVPAGGYKVYKISPIESFNRNTMFWAGMRSSRGEEIGKSTNTMENESIKVTVEKNGTLGILDKKTGKAYTNLNYYEDTGDCGDYWMYYPPHNNKTFTSLGSQAKIWMEDNGELSTTIGTEIKMNLPAYALRPENEIRGESRRSDEEKENADPTYAEVCGHQ